MSVHPLLTLALLSLLPIVSAAADDPGRCRHIDDDTQRLACYDEAFEAIDGEGEARSKSLPPAEHGGDPPRADQAATGNGSAFGADSIRSSAPDFIEANLVGEFTGWTGSTIFRLDNGQVWRQTRNYSRNYIPNEPIQQPRIRISRGMLGSYKMTIEGVNRVVHVKRVE